MGGGGTGRPSSMMLPVAAATSSAAEGHQHQPDGEAEVDADDYDDDDESTFLWPIDRFMARYTAMQIAYQSFAEAGGDRDRPLLLEVPKAWHDDDDPDQFFLSINSLVDQFVLSINSCRPTAF